MSHDGEIYAVHTGRFRPNAENRYQDYTLIKFQTRSTKREGKLSLPVDVTSMALDPKGQHLATCETGLMTKGDSYVLLWDLTDPDALAASEPVRRWRISGAIRDLV